MAKKNVKGARVSIGILEVTNSNKDNHYVLVANNVPIGETSGDSVNILDLNACDCFSNVALAKRGLDSIKVNARHEAFKEKYVLVRQEDKEEAEKYKQDYLNKTRKVPMNYGLQKAGCILEWLALNSMGESFGEETLGRMKDFRLKPLAR